MKLIHIYCRKGIPFQSSYFQPFIPFLLVITSLVLFHLNKWFFLWSPLSSCLFCIRKVTPWDCYSYSAQTWPIIWCLGKVSNNVRRTADCVCTLRYPKYIMLNRSSLLCNKRDKNCDKFQLQFSCIVSRLQSFRLLWRLHKLIVF